MTSHATEKSLRPIRIAGIQCAFQNNREKTIDRTLAFTRKALEKEATLVVYPECFTLPWFHAMKKGDYQLFAETVPGPSTEPFLQLSQENETVFVCPVYHVNQNRYFFASVIIQSGKILGMYKKIHLAAAEGWHEHELAEPGQELPVFKTGPFHLGIAMGWDAFFPEAFCAMALNQAQIVIVPTAAALGSKFRWLSLLSAHAVCNNLFVIRINRCGTEGSLSFYGESFCVDPFGNLIDEPTFHRDSLMIADLDLEEVMAARNEFPVHNHRRPEIYHLSDSVPEGRRNGEI